MLVKNRINDIIKESFELFIFFFVFEKKFRKENSKWTNINYYSLIHN